MAHVRTQIRDVVVAALKDHAPYGASVFKARNWPLAEISLPAVIVWMDGGPSAFDAMAEDDADVTLERTEQLLIEGRARSTGGDEDGLDATLDDIAAAVEPLMMKSAELGALIDRRELVRTDKKSAVVGDAREGLIRLTYAIGYVTAAGDPTTKV